MAIKAVEIKRSGFLSQLINGRPVYAEESPRLFEDFQVSVLTMSDTSINSHRAFSDPILLKEGQNAKGISSEILGTVKHKDETQDDVRDRKKKKTRTLSGLGEFSAYYYNFGKKPDKKTTFYETFSILRKLIFRSLKMVDSLIRFPAMTFAAFQLLFERGGWKLQTAFTGYTELETVKNTHPVLLIPVHLFVFMIRTIGLMLNVIGAVGFRACGFISKIAAEAIRMPLAILSAGFGIVFGGIVGLFQQMADHGNGSSPHSFAHSMFQGMIDGIRPFAPETANTLQVNRLKILYNTDISALVIRKPFHGSNGVRDAETIDIPWFSVAMFTAAVAAVILLSTVSFGFGGLLSMPLLPYLFHATGIAGGGAGLTGAVTFMQLGPVLSKLCMATMGLMSIGALQATFVGVGRGIQAFFNDVTTEPTKPAQAAIVPTTSQHQQQHIAAVAPNPGSPSGLHLVAAPGAGKVPDDTSKGHHETLGIN